MGSLLGGYANFQCRLRVHPTQEWHDLYQKETNDELQSFLDHYLKGLNNNWEKSPKVRVSMLTFDKVRLHIPAFMFPILLLFNHCDTNISRNRSRTKSSKTGQFQTPNSKNCTWIMTASFQGLPAQPQKCCHTKQIHPLFKSTATPRNYSSRIHSTPRATW